MLFSILLVSCALTAMEPAASSSSSTPIEIERSDEQLLSEFLESCPKHVNNLIAMAQKNARHWLMSLLMNLSSRPIEPQGTVTSLAWNRDSTRLATRSWDGNIRLINAQSGTTLSTIFEGTAETTDAWSHDSMRFATVSSNGNVRIVDAQSKTVLSTTFDGSAVTSMTSIVWGPGGSILNIPVLSVVWNHDDTRVAIGLSNGSVPIIDAQSGAVLSTILNGSAVFFIAWNHDGTRLATRLVNGNVSIIDVQSGAILFTIPHNSGIQSIAWSHDGTRLAIGSEDSNVRIIDVQSRAVLSIILRDVGGVRSIAWNHDSTRLATGLVNGNVSIIDVQSGTVLCTFLHREFVRSIAWSRDGTRLATVACGSRAHITDIADAEERATQITVAQHDLLQALALAARDTKKLPRNQTARIHANEEQWETWQELTAVLPEQAIKRLSPYIVQGNTLIRTKKRKRPSDD